MEEWHFQISLPSVVAFIVLLGGPFPFEVAAKIQNKYSAFCLSPLMITVLLGGMTTLVPSAFFSSSL